MSEYERNDRTTSGANAIQLTIFSDFAEGKDLLLLSRFHVITLVSSSLERLKELDRGFAGDARSIRRARARLHLRGIGSGRRRGGGGGGGGGGDGLILDSCMATELVVVLRRKVPQIELEVDAKTKHEARHGMRRCDDDECVHQLAHGPCILTAQERLSMDG